LLSPSASPEGSGEPQKIVEQGKGHGQSQQGCREAGVRITLGIKSGSGFSWGQTPVWRAYRGDKDGVFHQPLLAPSSHCLIIIVFSVQTFWVPCRGSLSHPSREKTKSSVFSHTRGMGRWFGDDSSALHLLWTLFLLLLHTLHLQSSGIQFQRLGTPVTSDTDIFGLILEAGLGAVS